MMTPTQHKRMLQCYSLASADDLGAVLALVPDAASQTVTTLPALRIDDSLPTDEDHELLAGVLPSAQPGQAGWFCLELGWPATGRVLRRRLPPSRAAVAWVIDAAGLGFALVGHDQERALAIHPSSLGSGWRECAALWALQVALFGPDADKRGRRG